MKEAIQQYLKDHGFGEFSPKAVLFDMDGVLYNSMPNHAVAWQESMKQFDIHMTAADAYATEGARGIDTIQMMVKKQKGEDISLEEVNPFNQPGVEAYKKNMFALLNKPGYEAESKAIQERLANEK